MFLFPCRIFIWRFFIHVALIFSHSFSSYLCIAITAESSCNWLDFKSSYHRDFAVDKAIVSRAVIFIVSGSDGWASGWRKRFWSQLNTINPKTGGAALIRMGLSSAQHVLLNPANWGGLGKGCRKVLFSSYTKSMEIDEYVGLLYVNGAHWLGCVGMP